MPFKIIETIERGRRLISTVPSLWEKDGNLYWPKKNVNLLKKNEKSTPQSDWKCLPCILLRENIFDYETAEQDMALMSDATDTENKENKHPRKNNSIEINFNNMATECLNASNVAEEVSPMVAAEYSSTDIVVKDSSSTMMARDDASSAMVAKDSYSMVDAEGKSSIVMVVESRNALISLDENNILTQDPSQEFVQDYGLQFPEPQTTSITESIQVPQQIGHLTDLDQQYDLQFPEPQTATTTESIQVPQQIGYLIEIMSNIQENQKILFENQQNILKSLALVNTKLEEFFTRSQIPQEQNEQSSSCFEMITNIEEFAAFEEQLKDPLMETTYLKEFSIICSDKKTGHNNAYALVDVMFDRKFMTCCSWGGGTKGEPKHCFKAFSKTIDLFLKVVHEFDKTFTKPICEEFFKNVLRHSVKRNTAKRVRISTTKKKITKSENKLQDENSPEQSSVSHPT